MGSSRDERSTCCFQVLLLPFTGMTNRDCIWKLGKVRSAEKGVRGDGDRGGSPVSSGQRVPGTPNLMVCFRDKALSSGSRGGERGSVVSVICYPDEPGEHITPLAPGAGYPKCIHIAYAEAFL